MNQWIKSSSRWWRGPWAQYRRRTFAWLTILKSFVLANVTLTLKNLELLFSHHPQKWVLSFLQPPYIYHVPHCQFHTTVQAAQDKGLSSLLELLVRYEVPDLRHMGEVIVGVGQDLADMRVKLIFSTNSNSQKFDLISLAPAINDDYSRFDPNCQWM